MSAPLLLTAAILSVIVLHALWGGWRRNRAGRSISVARGAVAVRRIDPEWEGAAIWPARSTESRVPAVPAIHRSMRTKALLLSVRSTGPPPAQLSRHASPTRRHGWVAWAATVPTILLVPALVTALVSAALAIDPAAADTLTRTASADARIDGLSPDTNYGQRMTLRADADGPLNALLKFDVGGLTATVLDARLRLRVWEGSAVGPMVSAVSTAWPEETVTWNTAPPPGAALVALPAAVTGETIEADVTSLLSGEASFAFRISTISRDGMSWYSAQMGSAPELIITTAVDATPPPAPTTTPTAAPTPTEATRTPTPTITPPIPTPTATPSPTASPTPTPTATPTPLPTATPVPTATPAPTPTPTPPSGGNILGIDLLALPQSGTAYNRVHALSLQSGVLNYGDIGGPNNDILLAKAIFGDKVGVLAMVRAAKSTLNTGINSLAAARNLAATVIALNLVNAHEEDAWLLSARDMVYSNFGSLAQSAFKANNHGSAADQSLVAIDLHLGATADLVNNVIPVVRERFGQDMPGIDFSFGDLSWPLDSNNPVVIGLPGSVKQGVSLDGILGEEQRRISAFPVFNCGNYNYGASGQLLLTAYLLNVAGYGAEAWTSSAVLRVFQRLDAGGCDPTGDDRWQGQMVNSIYGVTFMVEAVGDGKTFGLTDYLFGG